MKKLLFLVIVLMFCPQITAAQKGVKSRQKIKKPRIIKPVEAAKCLPAGITLETVVSAENSGFDEVTQTRKVSIVDVKETLKKIGGKCFGGKLKDQAGKEIKFYYLKGCWGNPPFDYQEILADQAKELSDLRKKFTVVELTCNPTAGMIM